MKDKTDYVALSKHIQSKGYKRNLSGREIENNKREFEKSSARSKALRNKTK